MSRPAKTTDHGVIVDIEATRSIRQAEVGSTKTMFKRFTEKFDPHPKRLIADTAYGTGPMLGSLVDRKFSPHLPVLDKSGRADGTWTRVDFKWDFESNQCICLSGFYPSPCQALSTVFLIPATEALHLSS